MVVLKFKYFFYIKEYAGSLLHRSWLMLFCPHLIYMIYMWIGHVFILPNIYAYLFCCRDLVHRQTACAAIKHMALGVYGFGCEDALIHLLNYVWPNIFETSPHLVQAFMDSVEGLRVALGPIKILQYTLQVIDPIT